MLGKLQHMFKAPPIYIKPLHFSLFCALTLKIDTVIIKVIKLTPNLFMTFWLGKTTKKKKKRKKIKIKENLKAKRQTYWILFGFLEQNSIWNFVVKFYYCVSNDFFALHLWKIQNEIVFFTFLPLWDPLIMIFYILNALLLSECYFWLIQCWEWFQLWGENETFFCWEWVGVCYSRIF